MEPGPATTQSLDRALATDGASPDLRWFDLRELMVEGKGWGDTETFYDRWPARARGTVSDVVWQLGQRSAGISARFVTDSPTVAARWTLRFPDLQMDRMPATGVSGVDLYARDAKGWAWVGVGREPRFPQSVATVASEMTPGTREFRLYLPLYNGVESIEVGIEKDSILTAAAAPASAPICFYGTSIVQGACASRPGMAYPAILGRRLDRPTINLGLSGNARAEAAVADLLAELSPAAYVLDCLPNMTADLVAANLPPFVRRLRDSAPDTPILAVENIVYPRAGTVRRLHDRHLGSNAALRDILAALDREGVTGLHRVPCDHLLGSSGDATVDGTHPSDVGMLCLADAIEPALRAALGDS